MNAHCVWLMCFYTTFCLYVCIFFLCATIVVNKDVYIKYKLRTMPFTFEEKCFIKILRQEKGWGAKWICSKFRQKEWAVSSVTIFYGKSTKLVQLSEKLAVDADGLFERNGISRVACKWPHTQSRGQSWYQQVFAKSRKLPAYRVHFAIVYRALP